MQDRPRRETFLPFSRPMIGEEEIAGVVETLRSGWVTTGPKAARFERELESFNGVPHCLALLNATTGLEATLGALGIGPGDEVITTAHTFVCTVSNVVLRGAVPVLVDVEADTMNLDAERIEERISPRTKAIVPVHYAGLPCRMERIWEIAARHGLAVIEDAAHTMGARYRGKRIGSDPRSAFSVYSFHPNKNLTTLEGGAVAFHDARHGAYLRAQRFHGIARGEGTPFPEGSPLYDVPMPGRKSNFMDVQAAVGLAQLPKLDGFAVRRGELARLYLSLLADVPEVDLPADGDAESEHCWNLFVLRNRPEATGLTREEMIAALKAENVGTGVHWQGLFGFSFYRDYFAKHPEGLPKDGLPRATRATDELMSLPLWPGMSEDDVLDAVAAVKRVVAAGRARSRA
jgi:dTDP-4-amino-4,6-dideoxygalactose transaminase